MVVDALAARFGGTAYAAVEVSSRLARDPRVGSLVVVAQRNSLVADGLADTPGVSLRLVRPEGAGELIRRLIWETLVLPGLAPARASLLTWSGMLPRHPRAAVVSYLANPLMFTGSSAADKLRRAAAKRTAQRAAAVLVPTTEVADSARRLLGVRPEIVPLGVNHQRFAPVDSSGSEVVCVGDFYPHKRHDLVISAWEALPEPRPRLRLVGDGRVHPEVERLLRERLAPYLARGEVVLETDLRLADPAFVAAYRRARLLVLCSEQETFSLPLLEAQAAGVPAVVRDSQVLRETGGPATTYVAGDDPRAWALEMDRLIRSDAAHERARAGALAHAARYSWDITASAIAARLLARAPASVADRTTQPLPGARTRPGRVPG